MLVNCNGAQLGLNANSGTLQSLDEGLIVGLAASCNTVDLGGDVIAYGAFSGAIPRFLESGFITFGHQWDRPPIGMPLAAIESRKGLIVLAKLHQIEEASAVKQIVKDRLTAGLTVGLSIGYSAPINQAIGFRSGEELLRQWGRLGVKGEPDEASLRQWDRPCRLIQQVEALYEASIVSVPMNPKAHLLARIHSPQLAIEASSIRQIGI